MNIEIIKADYLNRLHEDRSCFAACEL